MSRGKTYKPGERAPASGQYQIIGPRGSKGPERTVVKGEPFPATFKSGSLYKTKDLKTNKMNLERNMLIRLNKYFYSYRKKISFLKRLSYTGNMTIPAL